VRRAPRSPSLRVCAASTVRVWRRKGKNKGKGVGHDAPPQESESGVTELAAGSADETKDSAADASQSGSVIKARSKDKYGRGWDSSLKDKSGKAEEGEGEPIPGHARHGRIYIEKGQAVEEEYNLSQSAFSRVSCDMMVLVLCAAVRWARLVHLATAWAWLRWPCRSSPLAVVKAGTDPYAYEALDDGADDMPWTEPLVSKVRRRCRDDPSGDRHAHDELRV
jgi:hypothetical protein